MTKKQIAFTLIELLVVIAIIGILSGLIIVSMNGVTQKANIAKAQVFSNSLRNALMMNIVGEWKMDEGSGQAAADSWGGINNGTLHNFTDYTAGYGDSSSHPDGWMSSSNCISGTCLKFDGVNDYIDCGGGTNSNLTSDFTIGVWLKTSSGGVVLAKRPDANNANYIFGINTNVLNLQWTNPIGAFRSLISGNSFSLNQWHYVVLTHNNNLNIINFYIDGVPDSSNPQTTPAEFLSNGGKLFIGVQNEETMNSWYSGFVDDVRIYNAAIPTSLIKEQYYAGLNGLLANRGITKEEYTKKILEIAIK